jgi:ADP-ribose pyrophosphatase YjhB (NUDIX family)
MNPIVYCADVIARYGDSQGPLVLIRRLGSVKGLALPGGKQEQGEILSETACRELFEETGLTLTITDVLETRAEPKRDPRGNFVTTVFLGTAEGVMRDEDTKTRACLLSEEEVVQREREFSFDHFSVLINYLKHTHAS